MDGSKRYFVAHSDGSVTGPITAAEVRRLARNGVIGPNDKIQIEGSTRWRNISEIGGIEFGSPSPSAGGEPYEVSPEPSSINPVSVERRPASSRPGRSPRRERSDHRDQHFYWAFDHIRGLMYFQLWVAYFGFVSGLLILIWGLVSIGMESTKATPPEHNYGNAESAMTLGAGLIAAAWTLYQATAFQSLMMYVERHLSR